MERLSQVHDRPLDGPPLIDAELQGKLKATRLLSAKVCKECLQMLIFELDFEAMGE